MGAFKAGWDSGRKGVRRSCRVRDQTAIPCTQTNKREGYIPQKNLLNGVRRNNNRESNSLDSLWNRDLKQVPFYKEHIETQ